MDEINKRNQEQKNYFNDALTSIKEFFSSVLTIEGTDVLGTIDSVKKDMVFRGHTAWILMFSILIASVGLNANSTPVIIGAMLVSPLMGPIVALGLAVGTQDFELLKRALKNFMIAVVISLITSTVYFILSPLKEATSELLARTNPTILDVIIAFFGGFAGIVAGSRRIRGNVIPGVAIATALMPPLCTAGYGLATWQLNFFFGALYLFFINSVFISLSTIITVRYMKFPRKTIINEVSARKIKRIMTFFVILVILPSLIIFLRVIKESRFTTNAGLFVQEVVKSPNSQLINSSYEYSDTLAFINLYFIGNPVSDSSVYSWMMHLPDYNLVAKNNIINRFFLPDSTIVKVYQTGQDGQITEQDLMAMNENLQKEIRIGVLEDIYKKNEDIIRQKDNKIEQLQIQLNKMNSEYIPINQLYKELKIQYPRIVSFSYGKNIKIVNDTLTDTIPTFVLTWQYGTSRAYKNQKIPVLNEWLKVRFNLDTLSIVEER
ncbi:MAG: DUF389 domain-containing protein [Bacteroidales bacterium]|nr:DUF389 domain-containing protein [Bacteroidales bacterium]